MGDVDVFFRRIGEKDTQILMLQSRVLHLRKLLHALTNHYTFSASEPINEDLRWDIVAELPSPDELKEWEK